MRLSDLLSKRSASQGAPPRGTAARESAANLGVVPVASKVRSQSGAGIAARPASSGGELRPNVPPRRSYEDLPDALVKAAQQMRVPIPPDHGRILQQARDSLQRIIEAAVKPSGKKDGLWEASRGIADTLAQLLDVDCSLGRALEYDPTRKERLVAHSLNTSFIAMDLYKRLRDAGVSVQDVGAAGLLHDVGTLSLGQESTLDQADKSPAHVARGLEILNEMRVPKPVTAMIAQHHEKVDGSGYPNGIAGTGFSMEGQVLALADTFERIMYQCSHGDHRPGTPRINYVQATLGEVRTAIDARILKAFIARRGLFPEGIMVELTNRSICLVIKQNEGFPLHPVVQVEVDAAGNHPDTPRIIDLRSSDSLAIIRAVTIDKDEG